ncbi:hypothetical protein D3C84_975060 [compost metagenome]
MTQRQHSHREHQPLDQRTDDQGSQLEIDDAGRRDHGQANHQKGHDQVVTATQAIAEGQEQTHPDQQHAADRVIAQDRDQQQPDRGG